MDVAPLARLTLDCGPAVSIHGGCSDAACYQVLARRSRDQQQADQSQQGDPHHLGHLQQMISILVTSVEFVWVAAPSTAATRFKSS